jgi:heme exporter protein B
MAEKISLADVGGRPAGSAALSFGRAVAAVVWKDLAAEWRSREVVAGMVVFALLSVLIFHFALDVEIERRPGVAAGVLWTTLSFAGTIGLSRSMAKEKDRDSLDGLLLAPVDRSAIFFGKAGANLIFVWVVAAVLLPVYGVLYNVSLLHPGLLASVALGTLGYTAAGTLLSAMAVQARTREVLLPILLFPIVLPVIVAGLSATEGFLAGWEPAEILRSLRILVAYDAIFLAVGWMGFEFVVEE